MSDSDRGPGAGTDVPAFGPSVVGPIADLLAAGDLRLRLEALAALRVAVEEALPGAVREARGRGWSWAEVAEPLGVSRQAAQQRYGGGPPPIPRAPQGENAGLPAGCHPKGSAAEAPRDEGP